MQETTVTCHECKTQHVFHTEEWPPKMFVCSECGSFFFLSEVTEGNEPVFNLAGYCRTNS